MSGSLPSLIPCAPRAPSTASPPTPSTSSSKESPIDAGRSPSFAPHQENRNDELPGMLRIGPTRDRASWSFLCGHFEQEASRMKQTPALDPLPPTSAAGILAEDGDGIRA